MAVSFHLPSVSTANSNTVQYTKPYQQCEIPTITVVVISKVRLPQSIIMAAFVHSNSRLSFDVYSCLPKYNKNYLYITKFKFIFSPNTSCTTPHTPAQKVQLPTHTSIFLSVVSVLLGKSPASVYYCMPTFRNSLSVPFSKAMVEHQLWKGFRLYIYRIGLGRKRVGRTNGKKEGQDWWVDT